MQRGTTATPRWRYRLGAALLASALLHSAPLVALRALGRVAPLDLDVEVRTVELGLEDARPGTAAPLVPAPSAPAPAATAAPTATVAPPRARPAPRPAPVARPRPAPDALDEPLPEPSLHLREPGLVAPLRRPRPLADANPTALASAQPAPEPSASAAPAEPPPIPSALPGLSASASTLAPLVPRGALLTLLLRTDRLRANPNARAVQRVLGAIPDWEAMIGGSSLDPVRDLDQLLLAAANPFGADEQAPDWFVVARGARGSDAALRRAIEAMAISAMSPQALASAIADEEAARARAGAATRAGAGLGDSFAAALAAVSASASAGATEADGGAPPTTSASPSAGATASASARPRPRVFRDEQGLQTVTLERYGARRTFALLGDGSAVIALPSQLEGLRAALARRGEPLADADDPRLVLLLEWDGVRNMLRFNTWRGPFPFPARMAFALYQRTSAEGVVDGGAELVGRWRYDDATQAEQGAAMLTYSRDRWHVHLAERASPRGGLAGMLGGLGASLLGIDVPNIDAAIDTLRVQAEGREVVLRATLSPAQVRAVLSLAALGGAG